VCARPAVASPVVRWHGSQALTPASAVATDSSEEARIDAFLAVLANPSGAGVDEACTAYQLTNMNALKALSINGLGGVAEVTAAEMDVLHGVELALGEMVDNQDALLIQALAAQDLISAMIGVPLMGLDSLAAIDELAETGDLDSLLAGLLSNDTPTDVTVGEAELAEATEAEGVDTTLFASSLGGGGAWYGGHLADLGYGGGGGGSSDKSYGGDAGGGSGGGGGGGGGKSTPHHSHAKHNRLALAAAQSVPLPSGAWAGLALLATLGVAHKLRRNRVTA